MAHTGMGVQVFADEAIFQFGDPAFLFVYAQVVVEQCNSGTVISPVFEAF
jgi:hypothetical protein